MAAPKRMGKAIATKAKYVRRKESSSKKANPRGSRGRFVRASPARPAMSGKFLSGETPENFGNRRSGTSDNDHENIENGDDDGSAYEDDEDYEDYENNEQSPEPPLKAEDDDGDDEYSSLATTPAKTKKTRGKTVSTTAVAKVPKMTYNKNKGARIDSVRFTTSQAMAQAAEEFLERVAAFRGRKAFGRGNGRKHGRKLIRWTSATDQLLLLCLHHEFVYNKMDLPYDAIAERMFPDKNATGGAIKERFAKLRIECLNRGSWVPPIVGKTPQGSRPDIRGVVRLAPGIDEGRYILWKEDASRLIDPKDINKAYIKAQAEGLKCPQRVWISKKARNEFFTKNAIEPSVRLSELNSLIPDDEDDGDDEHSDEDDEEEEYESELESEQDAPVVHSTTKRKKVAGPATPNKKAKRANKSKSGANSTDEDSEVEDGTKRNSHPKTKAVSNTRNTGSVKKVVSASKSKSRKINQESPKVSAEDSDHVTQSIEHGSHVDGESDEEERPGRNIVVVKGFPQGVLQKYPAGIQGPGDDEYDEEKLIRNASDVEHDDKDALASDNDDTEEIAAFMGDDMYEENPGLVFVPEVRSQHYGAQMQQNLGNGGNNLTMRLQNPFVNTSTNQHQNGLQPFGDFNQLMSAMQDNMVDGVAIDYNLYLQHSQALDNQTMLSQQYGGFGGPSIGSAYQENPTGQNIMNQQSNINDQRMDAIPHPNSVQVMSDWDNGLQFNAFMDMLPDEPVAKPEFSEESGLDHFNSW